MSVYSTKNWVFDPSKRTLTFRFSYKREKLPYKVSLFLELLCKNQNEFVSNNEIIDELWDGNYLIGERGLRQVAWKLRKALTTGNNVNPIENIQGKGYGINQDISIVDKSPKMKNILTPVFALLIILTITSAILIKQQKLKTTYIENIKTEAITTDSGLEELFAISPDGETLLYNKKLDGVYAIYSRNLKNKKDKDKIFLKMKGDLGGMDWNHAGNKVAVLNNSGEYYTDKIFIYDLVTNETNFIDQSISSAVSQSPYGLSWSPNRNILAYSAPVKDQINMAIFTYNVDTNESHQITEPQYINTHPQWSPDGNIISFVSINRLNQIKLSSIDLSTKQTKELTNPIEMIYGHTWIDNSTILYSSKSFDAFVAHTINYNSLNSTSLKLSENFQFPHFANNEIYFLNASKEYNMVEYNIEGENLKFVKTVESIGNDLNPVIHAKTGKLLFISDRTGNKELWYRVDTKTKPIQLTFKETDVAIPSFSGNGDKLLYKWLNKNTNNYQFGVYDLNKMTEIPIDSFDASGGYFAGSDDVIAYIKNTENGRELWSYTISSKQHKLLHNEAVNLFGATPLNNTIYFDTFLSDNSNQKLYSYNLTTDIIKSLANINMYKHPIIIENDKLFHLRYIDNIAYLMELNLNTLVENELLKFNLQTSKSIYNFAISKSRKKLILNLHTKNEGDIFKFSSNQMY